MSSFDSFEIKKLEVAGGKSTTKKDDQSNTTEISHLKEILDKLKFKLVQTEIERDDLALQIDNHLTVAAQNIQERLNLGPSKKRQRNLDEEIIEDVDMSSVEQQIQSLKELAIDEMKKLSD